MAESVLEAGNCPNVNSCVEKSLEFTTQIRIVPRTCLCVYEKYLKSHLSLRDTNVEFSTSMCCLSIMFVLSLNFCCTSEFLMTKLLFCNMFSLRGFSKRFGMKLSEFCIFFLSPKPFQQLNIVTPQAVILQQVFLAKSEFSTMKLLFFSFSNFRHFSRRRQV